MTLDSPTTITSAERATDERTTRRVLAIIAKRSFCTIATSSSAQHAHAAGVVYVSTDGALWVHTLRTSRKAQNVAANGRVGVCIPFRRLPVGPPFTIHFQARAELVAMDDPAVAALIDAGRLQAITGHGELEMPHGCFIRVQPRGRIHSFGPGARLLDLIRDPLNSGAHSFDYAQATS